VAERDDFLHLLRDRRARFHRVLAEVGIDLDREEDVAADAGGGWPLALHLVHLAAWERRFARTVTRGPKLPYPSQWQKFNDAVVDHWQGVGPDAARREYGDAHRELVEAVAALAPEGDPDRPKLLVGWNLGMAPRHYREHATIVIQHFGLGPLPIWRGRIVD
jgi:hypothetical protein